MNVESSVLERYSRGAQMAEPSLCCAVDYDQSLLDLLPAEVIEKDYGCGDPSRYVCEGDTVLDLGSGSGKICYIASQLVGPGGRVIGVDMNDDMLALARSYQSEMAAKIGEDRVRFVKAQIQDLATDLEAMDRYLESDPVQDWQSLSRLKAWQAEQQKNQPLIKDMSVDLVVSNCVLNLVDDGDKKALMREIFRVTRPGGRIAISDIVSDVAVPQQLKADSELWSGCISGAMQERDFLQAFVDEGFEAVSFDKWDPLPWQTVEGIEFRAVTVTAVKPVAVKDRSESLEVMYCGPYASVTDDSGQTFLRGQRMRVPTATCVSLVNGTYTGDFVKTSPSPEQQSGSSCCSSSVVTLKESADGENSSASGGCCG